MDHRKPRILVAKPGLDGHDRGAKYVTHILRDAGFEVIYTGIRRTPEQIVESAIQEDVAAVGLSLLSGAHNVLFRRVIELLREKGAGDIVVFGGGTIPPEDVPGLEQMGVSAVFGPGTSAKTIVEIVERLTAQPAVPFDVARPSTELGTTPSSSPLDLARGDAEAVEGSKGRGALSRADAANGGRV